MHLVESGARGNFYKITKIDSMNKMRAVFSKSIGSWPYSWTLKHLQLAIFLATAQLKGTLHVLVVLHAYVENFEVVVLHLYVCFNRIMIEM